MLLGLEWNYRYNLSKVQTYEEQKEPWEPTSYSKNSNEVTFENGKFLQIKSRSGRWESVAVSPHGRGDVAGSGGTREMALAHYAVRAGLPENNYTWLKRYRDYMIEHHGCCNCIRYCPFGLKTLSIIPRGLLFVDPHGVAVTVFSSPVCGSIVV